jgi:hypothetical protein
MTKKSNLFGASLLELDAARLAVEHALGTPMESHESAYRGGDYFRLEKTGVKLVLQTNFMEDDGEVTEAEYPDADVLLYLDGDSNDVDGMATLVIARLNSFKLLRTSTY